MLAGLARGGRIVTQAGCVGRPEAIQEIPDYSASRSAILQRLRGIPRTQAESLRLLSEGGPLQSSSESAADGAAQESNERPRLKKGPET